MSPETYLKFNEKPITADVVMMIYITEDSNGDL